MITDSHVRNAFWYAIFNSWTVDTHSPVWGATAIPNFLPRPRNYHRQTPVIDDQFLPKFQTTPDGLLKILNGTKTTIDKSSQNAIFPLTIRGIEHRWPDRHGIFVKCHFGKSLRQKSIVGPTHKNNRSPTSRGRTIGSQWTKEITFAAADIQHEVCYIFRRERFLVLSNFFIPLVCFLTVQRNCSILEMLQKNLNIPFFSMQRRAERGKSSNATKPILNGWKLYSNRFRETQLWAVREIYTDNEIIGIIKPS